MEALAPTARRDIRRFQARDAPSRFPGLGRINITQAKTLRLPGNTLCVVASLFSLSPLFPSLSVLQSRACLLLVPLSLSLSSVGLIAHGVRLSDIVESELYKSILLHGNDGTNQYNVAVPPVTVDDIVAMGNASQTGKNSLSLSLSLPSLSLFSLLSLTLCALLVSSSKVTCSMRRRFPTQASETMMNCTRCSSVVEVTRTVTRRTRPIKSSLMNPLGTSLVTTPTAWVSGKHRPRRASLHL